MVEVTVACFKVSLFLGGQLTIIKSFSLWLIILEKHTPSLFFNPQLVFLEAVISSRKYFILCFLSYEGSLVYGVMAACPCLFS